jgi:hypothetical protein
MNAHTKNLLTLCFGPEGCPDAALLNQAPDYEELQAVVETGDLASLREFLKGYEGMISRDVDACEGQLEERQLWDSIDFDAVEWAAVLEHCRQYSEDEE